MNRSRLRAIFPTARTRRCGSRSRRRTLASQFELIQGFQLFGRLARGARRFGEDVAPSHRHRAQGRHELHVTELASREHVGRPALARARAGVVVGAGGEIHDRGTVAPLDEVLEPLEAATALHFLVEQHGIVGGPGESGLQAPAGRGLVFGG